MSPYTGARREMLPVVRLSKVGEIKGHPPVKTITSCQRRTACWHCSGSRHAYPVVGFTSTGKDHVVIAVPAAIPGGNIISSVAYLGIGIQKFHTS